MKNILMLLVLANVFYYIWGRYIEDRVETGVVVVETSQLGPLLQLSQPADEAGSGFNTLSVTSSESNLEAAVGRSCASLGPFKTNSEADVALSEYLSYGMQVSLRKAEVQIFMGHWVQIRDIEDEQTGNQVVGRLQSSGIREAYLVTTEEQGLKVSLGLFEERSRAERIKKQASLMEFVADISPRMRDTVVYFVDIGLPPGHSASTLIRKYGNDMVLLRSQATCPWSN